MKVITMRAGKSAALLATFAITVQVTTSEFNKEDTSLMDTLVADAVQQDLEMRIEAGEKIDVRELTASQAFMLSYMNKHNAERAQEVAIKTTNEILEKNQKNTSEIVNKSDDFNVDLQEQNLQAAKTIKNTPKPKLKPKF